MGKLSTAALPFFFSHVLPMTDHMFQFLSQKDFSRRIPQSVKLVELLQLCVCFISLVSKMNICNEHLPRPFIANVSNSFERYCSTKMKSSIYLFICFFFLTAYFRVR